MLLGLWKGPVSIGLYQAATNLVLYFNVVPRSINRALFPRMGRAWPDRPADFRRLWTLSLRLVALIGVPVTVGSLLLAPRTIDFLRAELRRGRPDLPTARSSSPCGRWATR